ncbi:hypothetical protein IPM65_04520 [Candidatus Roizmanbacteria bacterium]|nr:MAG: hypothetical protein IPM65_04520 [Candidatus Roizmanbacteria bacterium]
MNKLKLKHRIFMFIAIAIALGLTTTISPRFFIADSPEVNTQFIAELRDIPADTIAFIQNIGASPAEREIAELERKSIPGTPVDAEFQAIAPGVHAAESLQEGASYIKVDAGTKLEVRTVTLDDGRRVKVYIPVQ